MKLQTEKGVISISSDVFTNITGMVATSCYGVKGMAVRSKTDGLVHLLRRESMGRGVKVVLDGDSAIIDLHITVIYGAKVPEVAWEIQEKVKKAVETMTGLTVDKVNIYIEGVVIEKEPKIQNRGAKIVEKEDAVDEDVKEEE